MSLNDKEIYAAYLRGDSIYALEDYDVLIEVFIGRYEDLFQYVIDNKEEYDLAEHEGIWRLVRLNKSDEPLKSIIEAERSK